MSERACIMEDIENLVTGEEEVSEETEAERLARELAERQAELDKRERDLNKGFMEISARERELAERAYEPQAVAEDDDIPPLAPEAEKVLDKYIQRKIGPLLQSQQELYADTVNAELEAVSKRTGIPEETIIDTINSAGLAPKDETIKSARDVLNAAAKLAKAQSFDEEEFEKKIREKILKELAEQGARVDSIKPTRELPRGEVDLDQMTPDERYQFLKSRQEGQ